MKRYILLPILTLIASLSAFSKEFAISIPDLIEFDTGDSDDPFWLGYNYMIFRTSDVPGEVELRRIDTWGIVESLEIPSAVSFQGENYSVTALNFQFGDGWILSDNLVMHGGVRKLIIPSSVRAVKSKMHSEYLEEIIFDNSPIEQFQTSQFFDSKNLKRVDLGNACKISNLPGGFFYGCESLASVSLPQSLTKLNYILTSDFCSEGVFEGCTSLKSIELPPSLFDIGYGTFSGCTSLETIDITCHNAVSVGEDAFKDCVSLKTFQPVGGVSSIGERAFENCHSLTSANIYSDSELEISAYTFSGCSSLVDLKYNPSKLISVGRFAFYNCSSLKTFILSADTKFLAYNNLGQQYSLGNPFVGCTSIEKFEVIGGNGPTRSEDGVLMHDNVLIAYPAGKKDRAYAITDGVAHLTDAAFGGAKNLVTVTGGSNVEEMGTMVFSGCASLKEVALPAQLEALPGGTFAGCSALETVALPDGMTSLGLRAFDGCKALSAIELPATVDSIGESAFAGCQSIKSVGIPEGVTELLPATFRGCGSLTSIALPGKLKSIQFSALEGCSSLESVELPATVTEIGDRSFKDCDALVAVTIPDGVSDLGMGAFEDCDALRSVSVGNGIKEIGRFAFYDCEALETVRLGSSVTTIGDCAFDGDYNIREITCLSPEPPAYATGFPTEVVENATVNVPAGSEDAYNAATTWAPMVDGDDTALYNPVEAIQLDATALTLEIGGTYKLIADVFPLDADDASLIWSTSDDSVAAVNAAGIVTAVSPGNAIISATAADGSGVTADCSVNVVTFNPNSGLDAIIADGGVWDVYNVTGTLIGNDLTPDALGSLAPGLYIVRQGSRAVKVALP